MDDEIVLIGNSHVAREEEFANQDELPLHHVGIGGADLIHSQVLSKFTKKLYPLIISLSHLIVWLGGNEADNSVRFTDYSIPQNLVDRLMNPPLCRRYI